MEVSGFGIPINKPKANRKRQLSLSLISFNELGRKYFLTA
jgi:hypothetical protein